MNIAPERLVFVGGLHRSGTTPFAKSLDEHPDISGLTDTGVREDEGQHLQHVYPKAKVHGGSGRFAYAAAAHLTEQSPLATPANAQAMLRAWEPFWDLSRHLLVEKSPPNLLMGRFLQACYPGSALIIVVRHPVTVALSNKKWRRLSSTNPRKFETLSRLVDHWMVAHERLAEDLPALDRALVVHYENLVNQPAEELARVETFLGLDSKLSTSGWSAQHGASYAEWWDSLRNPLRPGGWQRRLIERKYADRAAAFGYGLDDLSTFHAVSDDPFGLLAR